jgi:hypothetical protein
VFTFALIPGAVYNALRQAALGGEVFYRVIQLRPVPAGARNDNGSVSYEALRQSLFLYRNEQPDDAGAAPVPPTLVQPTPLVRATRKRTTRSAGTDDQPQLEVVARPGGLAFFTIGSLLSGIVEVAQGAVNQVQKGIGRIDRAFRGSARFTVQTSLYNTDPFFGDLLPGDPMAGRKATPLIRPWGPNAGARIHLEGVRINVRAQTLGFLGTLFPGDTNADGWAQMQVSTGVDLSVCMEVENAAAEVRAGYTEIQICDFHSYQRHAVEDSEFVLISMQHGTVNVLAMASDGREWLKQVAGFHPHKAKILVGLWADMIGTFNGGAASAPCFTFDSHMVSIFYTWMLLLGETITLFAGPAAAAVVTGMLIFLVESIARNDIFLPSGSNGDNHRSRGVVIHEYGHFALCSLLASQGPTPIRVAYSDAAIQRITNLDANNDPPPDHDGAYINEAFADFFTSQVAGGVNYFEPQGSLFQEFGPMSWCNDASTLGPCMDYNKPSTTTFDDQVERIATILTDAFDRPNPVSPADLSSGTLWENVGTMSSPRMQLASGRFTLPTFPSSTSPDEAVSLPASAWKEIVFRQIIRDPATRPLIREHSFLGALDDLMAEHGYNWCQRCKVFALHEPGVPDPASDLDISNFCAANARIRRWMPAPPDPSQPGSCNAASTRCAPGTGMNPDHTQCVPCPHARYITNAVDLCEDCPATQINMDNTCVDCPIDPATGARLLVAGNQCVATCPGSTRPDSTGRRCLQRVD